MITNKKYRYAFIDAQYFLVRNTAMLEATSTRVTPQLLVKMFTYTIMKFKREVCDFGKPILCWDIRKSGVYDKANALPGYKDDRNPPISAWTKAIYEFEKLENPNETQITQLLNIRKEFEKYKVRELAKEFIIKYFGNLGINSLAVPGVEADDFACLLSEIAQKFDEPSILMTVDGDWKFLANEKVDFYHSKRNIIYSVEDVFDLVDYVENISLYEQKIIEEIFKSSHNNVSNPLAKLPNDHPLRNYTNILELADTKGIDAIIEGVPDEFKDATAKAIDALDIRKNRKDLIPEIEKALYQGIICYGSLEEINSGTFNYHDSRFDSFNIGVPLNKLETFVHGLNPNLYEKISYEKASKHTFEEFFEDTKPKEEIMI